MKKRRYFLVWGSYEADATSVLDSAEKRYGLKGVAVVLEAPISGLCSVSVEVNEPRQDDEGKADM